MELFGPVGGARLLLASDGAVVTAAVPGQRLHAEAPSSLETFEALLGLPLGEEDLLDLLGGALVGERARQIPAGGTVRFRMVGEASGRPREMEIRIERPGREADDFRVVYGETTQTPAGPLPEEVRLSRGDRALSLVLKGARLRDVLPGSFHLDPPPGFQRVDPAELARAGMVLFDDAPANPGVDTSPQLQ